MRKLIIIMSVLLSTNALADPASEIKQAIENNLKHTQQEDIEALQVFKKENGRWKIWTQSNLNIIYL